MTVLELLVVVAIIGILTLLTVPNIPEIIRGHRLRTANNDIVSKLRYIRGLAISKNRELEVTIDPTKQVLSVMQKAYTEYNMIDDLGNYDLNAVASMTSAELAAISGAPQNIGEFKIFSEAPKQVHVLPRWDKDGKPIYEIPINYDVAQTERLTSILRKDPASLTADDYRTIRRKSGVGSMAVNGTATVTKVTFMPSGIIEQTKVEIGIGSRENKSTGLPDPALATGYIITIYKGGQITSSNL